MFLKPEATKAAAEACGIELNYRPDLNWGTYESALAVGAFLKEAIADLRPRDMIDVQGFMLEGARSLKNPLRNLRAIIAVPRCPSPREQR